MTPIERVDDGLTALYEQHYTALVRLAAVLIDDTGTCEEIVQEAFAKCLTSRNRAVAGKEAQYMRSVVLNGARSNLRRTRVRRRHVPVAPPPHPAAEQEAVHRLETRLVLDALRSLPTRQAQVLALRYQADLAEAEIADLLGITAGSVKTHASRGLARLRELLGEAP